MDHTAATADLRAYRWRNRLLLVFAPDQGHRDLIAQRHLLIGRHADLAERELIVFELFSNSGQAGQRTLSAELSGRLREHFGVATKAFTLLLIGKDGTVKHRATAAVPPDHLFAQIDRMPMRRREIHGR